MSESATPAGAARRRVAPRSCLRRIGRRAAAMARGADGGGPLRGGPDPVRARGGGRPHDRAPFGELQVMVPGTNEPFLFVHEGDVSGLLPYSRMTVLRATARATRPSRVAFLHKQHFPDLLRELPSVAERLVWMLADRIREFAVHETHREKLMALGKLSAGLAHELNNPASAVQRAAAQLCTLLTELQAHAAGAAASSLAERLMVTDTPGDPLDRSDRERGLAPVVAIGGPRRPQGCADRAGRCRPGRDRGHRNSSRASPRVRSPPCWCGSRWRGGRGRSSTTSRRRRRASPIWSVRSRSTRTATRRRPRRWTCARPSIGR